MWELKNTENWPNSLIGTLIDTGLTVETQARFPFLLHGRWTLLPISETHHHGHTAPHSYSIFVNTSLPPTGSHTSPSHLLPTSGLLIPYEFSYLSSLLNFSDNDLIESSASNQIWAYSFGRGIRQVTWKTNDQPRWLMWLSHQPQVPGQDTWAQSSPLNFTLKTL